MTPRLQLEVSQLEGSLQQPKAQSSMSPYLVPDTAALCQHLHLIRQLASSGCFIIIIPRTGRYTWAQANTLAPPSWTTWAPGRSLGPSLLKHMGTRLVPRPLPFWKTWAGLQVK